MKHTVAKTNFSRSFFSHHLYNLQSMLEGLKEGDDPNIDLLDESIESIELMMKGINKVLPVDPIADEKMEIKYFEGKQHQEDILLHAKKGRVYIGRNWTDSHFSPWLLIPISDDTAMEAVICKVVTITGEVIVKAFSDNFVVKEINATAFTTKNQSSPD